MITTSTKVVFVRDSKVAKIRNFHPDIDAKQAFIVRSIVNIWNRKVVHVTPMGDKDRTLAFWIGDLREAK